MCLLFGVVVLWDTARVALRIVEDQGAGVLVEPVLWLRLSVLPLVWWLFFARGGQVPPRGRVIALVGSVIAAATWFGLADRAVWAWWCFVPLAGWGLWRIAASRVWARALVRICFVLSFGFAVFCGYALGSGYLWYPIPASPPAVAADRVGRWRQDLRYLDTELVRLHANAFHEQSPQEWRRRVEEVEAGLSEMSDLEIQVALAQLVASVGDAHTGLSPWLGRSGGLGYRRLPFQFAWFGDDLVVIAAAEKHLDLLWHRVTRFGPTPIEDAERLVRSVVSYETDGWFRRQSPSVFLMVELLEALGVLPAGDRVELELVSGDGDRTVVAIQPVAPEDPLVVSTARTGESRVPAASKSFWSVKVEDVLYVRYRRCEWSWPLREFAKGIAKHLDESPSTRLVIDLRNNPGGTSLPFLWLVLPEIVARPELNRPERLFVLVNRGTFSSGSGIAAELRNQTRATFVGEPTGGVPNGYGEVRTFRLPNSGSQVAYSTEHFGRLDGHGAVGVPVDQMAFPSVEDFRTHRDPALEWVLAR